MTKKQIKETTSDLLGLKGLVETYEEVAALRMQAIRGSVLKSRDFLDGLSGVFNDAKSNLHNGVNMMTISTLNRNNRSVAVFVSANTGLYGDIINKTYELFMEFVQKRQTEAVVIGKLGVRMIYERNPELMYNYFDFSDKGLDTDNLSIIMRYLLQFERIYVFHGKYRSLISQDPAVTSISGDEVVLTSGTVEKNFYLFEPNITEVLQMFEREIITTLFSQSIHEGQLAKFASRLFHLDQAAESVDNSLKNISVISRKASHKAMARKQLNTISGISLWA
ncbi:F0F1 ATP synthase subunit gamma [Candidatus Amesbacteria bacterium]|nr:F0F1 ATP synthase subunit gamma [Candidatus Amesbacteria bacterium]